MSQTHAKVDDAHKLPPLTMQERVRRDGILRLWKQGDRDAHARIILAVQQGPDTLTRQVAVMLDEKSYGSLSQDEARDLRAAFVEALTTSEADTRFAIADALMRVCPHESVAHLPGIVTAARHALPTLAEYDAPLFTLEGLLDLDGADAAAAALAQSDLRKDPADPLYGRLRSYLAISDDEPHPTGEDLPSRADRLDALLDQAEALRAGAASPGPANAAAAHRRHRAPST